MKVSAESDNPVDCSSFAAALRAGDLELDPDDDDNSSDAFLLLLLGTGIGIGVSGLEGVDLRGRGGGGGRLPPPPAFSFKPLARVALILPNLGATFIILLLFAENGASMLLVKPKPAADLAMLSSAENGASVPMSKRRRLCADIDLCC